MKVNLIGAAGAALVPLGLFDYRGGYSIGGIFANLMFASAMLFNAIYHLRGTLETKHYSPGVITGILLYVPLAIALYAHFVTSGAARVITAVVAFVAGSQLQRVLDSTHKRALKNETHS